PATSEGRTLLPDAVSQGGTALSLPLPCGRHALGKRPHGRRACSESVWQRRLCPPPLTWRTGAYVGAVRCTMSMLLCGRVCWSSMTALPVRIGRLSTHPPWPRGAPGHLCPPP